MILLGSVAHLTMLLDFAGFFLLQAYNPGHLARLFHSSVVFVWVRLGPFRIRSGSVRGPFRVCSGSVRDPFGIRSGSVRSLFGIVGDPFGVHYGRYRF